MASPGGDYYTILGVARTASAEDIRRAYRRQARRHHPDVNARADARARFEELSAAYEVLHDREQRARYDRLTAPRYDRVTAPRPTPRRDVPRFLDEQPAPMPSGAAGLRIVIRWEWPRPPQVNLDLRGRRGAGSGWWPW